MTPSNPDSTPGLLMEQESVLEPEIRTTSSYSDPDYGCAPPDRSLLIVSRATWTLEENQSPLTGWCGVLMLCICAYLLVGLQESQEELVKTMWPFRLVFLITIVFTAMALSETLIFKVYRRHFDFAKPRSLDRAALQRVGERYLGFQCCLLGTTAFTLSWQQFFPDFIQIYWICMPLLVLGALPYFCMVEKYAREDGPVDEMLVAGRCLKRLLNCVREGRSFSQCMNCFDNPYVENLARGLLIKCIFIPFMVKCYCDWWNNWEHDCLVACEMLNASSTVYSLEIGKLVRGIQLPGIDLLYAIDLTLALIGYIVSLRLFDTQFTSSEPTRLGWFATLVCYIPFGMPILDVWVWQRICAPWPEHIYLQSPALAITVSFLVIFFDAIYTWATVSFGLRFSNLSNRGIIANGPYRIVRHPAYLGKNVVFWLGVLPVLTLDWTGLQTALGVLSVNGIYLLRALTEERHLMREPHYQQYCEIVRWRLIPGIF